MQQVSAKLDVFGEINTKMDVIIESQKKVENMYSKILKLEDKMENNEDVKQLG